MTKMPTMYTKGHSRIEPPMGWVRFAMDNPEWIMMYREECLEAEVSDHRAYFGDLISRIARGNPYRADRVEEWDVAVDGGDCEDVMLRTMEELRIGHLEQTGNCVRAATCQVIATGEYHACLTIETTHNTYVIDYLNQGLWKWDELPYRWISRQAIGYWWDGLQPVPTLADIWSKTQ